MSYYNPPPSGPPPYYGYPPPASAAPGSFAYVPAPVMMPMYPPQQISTQPAFMYPPQPAPEPVHVVEEAEPPAEIVDWVPVTPATANSLHGKAFVAGKEGWDSSPLWSIRAHHKGNLIPGKLAIKHKAAYIPHSGKEIPVHNFEVLCAPSYAVHWLPGTNGEVPSSAIIAGNTGSGEPFYIGRARHKGSLTPGKVHCSLGRCYISFGGKEKGYSQYEVLCRMDGY